MARKKKEEVVEVTPTSEGKLIKVVAIKSFFDREKNRNRMVGDEFEVNDERYSILTGKNKYNSVFVKTVE